jgi:hypothetical protein
MFVMFVICHWKCEISIHDYQQFKEWSGLQNLLREAQRTPTNQILAVQNATSESSSKTQRSYARRTRRPTSSIMGPRFTQGRSALTSFRTLERWDLSTLLTAKYSMVFFFRPLYTVFDPHRTKSHNMPEKKQRNDQGSLALEPNPYRSSRIQG